jgi:hypothetical protein
MKNRDAYNERRRIAAHQKTVKRQAQREKEALARKKLQLESILLEVSRKKAKVELEAKEDRSVAKADSKPLQNDPLLAQSKQNTSSVGAPTFTHPQIKKECTSSFSSLYPNLAIANSAFPPPCFLPYPLLSPIPMRYGDSWNFSILYPSYPFPNMSLMMNNSSIPSKTVLTKENVNFPQHANDLFQMKVNKSC